MKSCVASPLARRILWVLFAVLFYDAGLAFTTWLLQPGQFTDGYRWLLVILFPVLVPTFFVVNRHLGCATGACAVVRCEPAAAHADDGGRHGYRFTHRPPG